MNESVASATALVVSLMRALHTRADPQPILDDPWGDILVPGSVIETIRQRIDSTAPENSRVSEKDPTEQRVDSWLRICRRSGSALCCRVPHSSQLSRPFFPGLA
jgi:O-methyltransferase involved in polyketide biosynthesis